MAKNSAGTSSELICDMRKTWDQARKENDPRKAAHQFILNKGKIEFVAEQVFDEISDEITYRLELKEDDSLLEVGCGSGLFLNRLKSRVAFIAGVDFSIEQLRHINDESVKFCVAEAAKLPFNDYVFDKVFCHSVFQYFPDIEYSKQSIEEMLRVSKPNGKLLISDILNGYLEDIRLYKERQNIGLHRRLINQIKSALRPLYKKIKGVNQPLAIFPLSIEPTFFPEYFRDSKHQCFPLLETVKSKPKTSLMFRYDVLICKNAK